MTSERECFVHIVLPETTGFVLAGRFRWTDDGDRGVGRFVYGRSYRERPDAVELDPVELHLSDSVFETARMDGFFGAIRDSMPDFWGRCVIERSVGQAALPEFDYLMRGPQDRPGALGFSPGLEPPAPGPPVGRTLDLAELQEAADTLVADGRQPAPGSGGGPDGPVAETAAAVLFPGSSMGGARPKAVVTDGPDSWIAKFGRQDDRWNQPRVEHGLLALAGACGLDVADSRIETVGGRDVLLVRRFDRERIDAGWRRHRMASALTLLRSGDGVADRRDWSYLLLADEIRRTAASPKDELRELFGRMCFNAAVSNLDDHPRNHAILAEGRQWRLSPAFDLTPSPVVPRERRDLAMTCGHFGRYANRSNLLSAHERFLLGRDEAEGALDSILNTVRRQWLAGMRWAGVSEQDCERIAPAFIYDGLFHDIDDELSGDGFGW